MARFSSAEHYEEEYASEATRAAQPSRPSYDWPAGFAAEHLESDLAQTRSPRESYAALDSLDTDDAATRCARPTNSDEVATRFARPRASAHAIADSDEVATRHGRSFLDADEAETRFGRSFVAPAELEGERSPAMRARRQSYVAPLERSSSADRDRRSLVASSERPVPAPPRPSRAELDRRSRASYVASSERNDFASSVPDADEVTSHREPAPRPSYASASSVDGSYSSSEIEELKAPPSVDYHQLRSFLFDDISNPQTITKTPPHKTTNPAFPAPPHGSSQLPPVHAKSTHPAFVPPAAPRSTHPAFAPQQHYAHHVPTQQSPYAQRPALTPSSSTPVAPLTQPRQRPATNMNMPAPQDSYPDSSWIVPTPAYPMPAPAQVEGGFRFSLGFLAAALTAAAALIVMIGAVLFIRSEDTPLGAQTFAMHANATSADEAPAAAQPLPSPTVATTSETAAPAAPPVKTAPTVAVKDLPKDKPAPTTLVTAKAKRKPVAVAVDDNEEDDVPAPKPAPKAEKSAKKTAAAPSSKLGDKTVEQMLADLGEEQLRR